jgi:hypothetical protein
MIRRVRVEREWGREKVPGSCCHVCDSCVVWQGRFDGRMDQVVESLGPEAMLAIEP